MNIFPNIFLKRIQQAIHVTNKFHYILDNGHGGVINGVYQTQGKRSPIYDNKQIFEGVYNREIVNIIYKYLNKINISCEKLVPEQEDISLKERVKRVNNIYKNKPNSILISIHLNAGGGSGYEIYTSKGEYFSDKIASLFLQYFEEHQNQFPIRKDISDGDDDKEANFYILKHTYCPAILTENLFMDKRSNFNYLISDAGKKKITQMHINSIINCEKYL